MKNNRYALALYLPSIFGTIIGVTLVVSQLVRIFHNQPVQFSVECLSSCVAIIGLAVATWVGLNIANAVERQDVVMIGERQDEIEHWINSQKRINKNFFLDELSKNTSNPIISEFFKRFSTLSDDQEINYLLLTELEQSVSRVLQLHELAVSDQDIIAAINTAQKSLKRAAEEEGSIVNTYCEYCSATLQYYLGYHDKIEEKTHFSNSIKVYESFAEKMGIGLFPNPNEESIEDYVDRAKEEFPRPLEAFLYNRLGDAYRFLDIGFAPIRAATYCSYACKHSKNNEFPKDKYLRNLGCALERIVKIRGGMDDISFEILKQNYIDSLTTSRPNSKNYKVILSLLDKQINRKLGIGFNGRKTTAYDSDEFLEKWNLVGPRHGEIDDLLSDMKKYADQAKQLFPQDPVGYQYKGVYYWHKYASLKADPKSGTTCPPRAWQTYKDKAIREKEIVDHLIKDDRVIEVTKSFYKV